MIRVAVVDDHPLFRNGVIQTLQAAADIEVVGEGASVEHAVSISRELSPNVLVLDVNLAEGGDGIQAISAIVADAPSVRILMLTVVADSGRMREAISKGARGYVLKGIGGAEFINAVRVVYSGSGYVTPTLAAILFARPDRNLDTEALEGAASMRLSAREEQILSCIARGMSNKEIGLRIELSEKTVKHYVTNLFQKMRVRNRTQAAIFASHMHSDRDSALRSGGAGARLAPFPNLEHTRPI